MTVSTRQFEITEAVITSPLIRTPLDIKNVIVDLELYENIERPYVSGKVNLIDTNGVFTSDNMLNFRGGETLAINVKVNLSSSPTENATYPIKRTFTITGIEKMAAAGNDSATMVVLSIVDPWVFKNYVKKFSRSFSGSPTEIIRKILTDERLLGLPQDILQTSGEPPVQKNMKVVIPYLTPLGAVEFIRDRCTTKNGSPFFLRSNVHSWFDAENAWLTFESLDYLLSLRPFNIDAPFVQSVAMINSDPSWAKPDQLVMDNVEFGENHNSLSTIMSGGLSSQLSVTDISSNKRIRSKHNIDRMLLNLRNQGVLKEDDRQNIFNEGIFFNEEGLEALPSMYFHQIVNTNSYTDANSFYDDLSPADYRKRVENIALRAALMQNFVKVQVPSYIFMAAESGVGETVSLLFSGNAGGTDTPEIEQLIDYDKSGNYLIYSLRHSFAAGAMSSSMRACKLDKNYKLSPITNFEP